MGQEETAEPKINEKGEFVIPNKNKKATVEESKEILEYIESTYTETKMGKVIRTIVR